ncbi:MAG: hypothetical protein MUP21_05355 [Dehalococcoidia bacterium]|nr:hypothetical protein [Dehalococcoidia bacterium]
MEQPHQVIPEFKTDERDIFEKQFASHTIHDQSVTEDGKVGSFLISRHYEDGSYRSDYSFRVTIAPGFLALSGDIGELIFPYYGVRWLTKCLPNNDKRYIFEKLSRDVYESTRCFDVKKAKEFVMELQKEESELTEDNAEALADIMSFLNGVESRSDTYEEYDWPHKKQEFFTQLYETGLVDEMPGCGTTSTSGLVRLAALRCFCRLYLAQL